MILINTTERSTNTKIIATIGPATSSDKKIHELIQAGIDMCRLNFSHGTYENHEKVIKYIRQANKELGSNIAILADLQGPKIRIGKMKTEGIRIRKVMRLLFQMINNRGHKKGFI